MRMVLDHIDIFECKPDENSKLLSDRDKNEAYLTYHAGTDYAVYFPNGGQVKLNLKGAPGTFKLRWLDIHKSEFTKTKSVDGGKMVDLKTPAGQGYWAAVITKE
jgi:hypothetical protein